MYIFYLLVILMSNSYFVILSVLKQHKFYVNNDCPHNQILLPVQM